MISIENEILKTIEAVANIDRAIIQQISDVCVSALRDGKKIMFAGNGGSAADSQHLAAELVSRLNFDRPGLPAIALTVDTSVITAIGNDYGFENIFSKQLEAIGEEGDVLIVSSTSGNSSNIINAIKAAKDLNIITIGKTGGSNGKMDELCDITFKVLSVETQKIQEGHIVAGHIYCGLIEEAMFNI